jgi:hypothetical protein
MAVKFFCDRCGAEVLTEKELYHVTIKNGLNTAAISEGYMICKKCADGVAITAKAAPAEVPVEEIK